MPQPAGGRTEAMDDGWTRHRVALVRLAVLLTGDSFTAEDVAAEAVARYLVSSRRQHIDDPGAYLRRILVNEVIGRGRRRRIEERHRFRLVRSEVVSDGAEHLADSDRIWSALQSLPARQRAVLVLRFYEDRSEAETASLLGVPPGTVKSNVARGLAALRKLLGEEEP